MLRHKLIAAKRLLLFALITTCSGNLDANLTLHTFEKRWKGEDIVPWANPYNLPVYLYRWDRGLYATYHLYGMFKVEHPLGVWDSVVAFGDDGYRLKYALTSYTPVKNFTYSNITDPEWGRGYEWEIHWNQNAKPFGFAVVEPLVLRETPIDWYAHTYPSKSSSAKSDKKGNGPIFRWFSDYDIHKVCENGYFKDDKKCWKHYRRGCNMPSGHCRRTIEEMDEYRYPKCSIMIPPNRNYTTSMQCPSPIVQAFREELNDVKKSWPKGTFTYKNLYTVGIKFGVVGMTTEKFFRKYRAPGIPVDAKRLADITFCRYMAEKWSHLPLGLKKKGNGRILADEPRECDEILSSVEQMRRHLAGLEAWRRKNADI